MNKFLRLSALFNAQVHTNFIKIDLLFSQRTFSSGLQVRINGNSIWKQQHSRINSCSELLNLVGPDLHWDNTVS